MKKINWLIIFFILWSIQSYKASYAESLTASSPGEKIDIQGRQEESIKFPEGYESDELQEGIPDPLEPLNRLFFNFNDKLYFWFLKPVALGYRAVVPRPVRGSVRDMFYNLAFPIRFVNCLFQAKFDGAANEFGRFIVNSTIGIGGLFDVAKHYDMKRSDEDLGQTLGTYGAGPAFFINWPVLGPSSLRDTVGLAGDAFLDPLNYIFPHTKYNAAVKGYKAVNRTSLSIGEYEDLKKAALDPYIAMRDAYFQYRQNEIKK